MQLYIPSKERADQQLTFYNLPEALRACTRVVCSKEEEEVYAKELGTGVVLAHPTRVRGIAAVRQWIVDTHVQRHGNALPLCMLDDDLRFGARREDDPTKFRQLKNEKELLKGFTAMERELRRKGGAALVGFCAREGGNRHTEPTTVNTRILRVLAYMPHKLQDAGARFDRIPVMEDFDVALQLLRAGHTNLVLNTWMHDQVRSNAPGGCSTYRTLEVQANAARRLAELHPDYVRVVQKTTKTAWGGGTRTDVQIAWKRAFNGDL